MIQLKLCMVGAFAVGKSSLVQRCVQSMFSEKYHTTVGVKIDKKDMVLGTTAVRLIIWDLAGEDHFSALRPTFMRGAAGYVLVADGTRAHTLDAALDLSRQIQASQGPLPFALVLNKVDLLHEWEITASRIAARLLAAAATRDGETGSHVRRIGLYAATMGEALGWAASRIADLRVAAPMHDIGKIGIPDAILRKPGALSEDEYRIMQDHTVIGARMLGDSDIPLLCMAREIALGHHEKWDGRGYPRRLAGEQIPIAARIVAIVDVYDAMVHRRVYKSAIPEPEVLAAMQQGAGRDFDPALFEVFLGVLPAIRAIRNTHVDEVMLRNPWT